ncbi:MAG: methyltransferase domain-containing protein [Bacteroidia bacterium]|nr:methyltransferase domain-containing protein [Bacteroidia bacterium]
MSDNILKQVNSYYTQKIIQNGATPQGVDWNSLESQQLRFEVLSTVITEKQNFSVLDYGCGFGSMYEYFKQKYFDFNFTGFDISEEMISEALKIYADDMSSKWVTSLNDTEVFDFTIASGIFNVKLENKNEEWLNYILDTLHKLNRHTVKGFSFNVLTKYSDKEFMRDYLYYADPLFLFDFCKTNFSRNVAILHDYNLYEFTIIVRK